MLIENYVDLSKYKFPSEDIYLYFEHFKFNIKNILNVKLIYLDTSKKAKPNEVLEFKSQSIHYLEKYDRMADNNFKIKIIPKIQEKELWKIQFEIEEYDDVNFFTVWG